MEIDVSGSTFSLEPSGALFWRNESALLLADLHLGKETVFQKSGIAIPQGATASTLSRLRRLVESYQPAQIIVLGDLLHAPTGLTRELSQELAALLSDWKGCRWTLVPGNHDRGGLNELRKCGWEVTASRLQIHEICLTHDSTQWSEKEQSSISGHLHPSIRIPLTARESTRVRCFWRREKQLIIPAFGGWTGSQPIQPMRGDQVWACAEGELIRLSGFGAA